MEKKSRKQSVKPDCLAFAHMHVTHRQASMNTGKGTRHPGFPPLPSSSISWHSNEELFTFTWDMAEMKSHKKFIFDHYIFLLSTSVIYLLVFTLNVIYREC